MVFCFKRLANFFLLSLLINVYKSIFISFEERNICLFYNVPEENLTIQGKIIITHIHGSAAIQIKDAKNIQLSHFITNNNVIYDMNLRPYAGQMEICIVKAEYDRGYKSESALIEFMIYDPFHDEKAMSIDKIEDFNTQIKSLKKKVTQIGYDYTMASFMRGENVKKVDAVSTRITSLTIIKIFFIILLSSLQFFLIINMFKSSNKTTRKIIVNDYGFQDMKTSNNQENNFVL